MHLINILEIVDELPNRKSNKLKNLYIIKLFYYEKNILLRLYYFSGR